MDALRIKRPHGITTDSADSTSSRIGSKEAGLRAGISPGRINDICEAAQRKLGVANRREAIRLVMAEIAAEPPTKSGAESAGLLLPDQGGSGDGVSGEALDVPIHRPSEGAASGRLPAAEEAPATTQHAARSFGYVAHLGRFGSSLDGDRIAGQYASGGGFCVGVVEGVHLPSRDAHPEANTRSHSPARRTGLLSWVRGGTRYADLTPPQRLGAMLLLMAAFAVLASLVLNFSLQINSTIQHAMPPTINSERPGWINLGDHHGTLTGRHHGR